MRQISVDGVAHADGRLKVGDKLLQVRDASEIVCVQCMYMYVTSRVDWLQVNGESVIGMPHHKAVALVKKAMGVVQLAVSRFEIHVYV